MRRKPCLIFSHGRPDITTAYAQNQFLGGALRTFPGPQVRVPRRSVDSAAKPLRARPDITDSHVEKKFFAVAIFSLSAFLDAWVGVVDPWIPGAHLHRPQFWVPLGTLFYTILH